MKRIVVIGAGPIGIETALYAQELGYNPILIEKNDLASNLLKCKHITFFSPFYMNSSELGIKLVNPDINLQDYCKIEDYINKYLKPISEKINNKLFNTKVISISKKNTLKNELIGSQKRAEIPFILHLRDKEKDFYLESDIVIDCSGTYDNPLNFGLGGLKILNQDKVENKINHYIPDIRGLDKDRYINKSILLIGTGYSAATSANLIYEIIKDYPNTKLFWISRSIENNPYKIIENDILELRNILIQDTNKIISENNKNIHFFSNSYIENIELEGNKLEVFFNHNKESKKIIIDEIISNVGYKPDNKIYEELQIHECYATHGIMKLSASLLSQTSTDCLNQVSSGLDTLKNPEPNFFIIGNKSYGRNSNFILKIGYEQIKDVFKIISE